MITIFIDNTPYRVKPDQNLLQACLSLGFDLPYFCWHPAMHSVGACRQCAVKLFKDDTDAKGRIVMSCMTPVADGMRLSVDDPEAKAFRASVLEWLMLNHPHDCPVCDEGGECHLQDMTVMTGHTYRRTRFRKRTHRNQYLGPLINHEMNRCIQCYRCVRFYRDIAGGRDLDVFACHDHVYFGRAEDGVLESEFSGNLIEVCPTGVFTDKTLKRHYTRKWDLQTAPSVCVHCGIGCNTIPGERSGLLRRVLNRYNHEVNGYFLCDRGRFGYEFVNSDRRIRTPLIKTASPRRGEGRGEGAKAIPKGSALTRIQEILSKAKGIIGIGSPRATLEANYALRALVGPDRFHSGMSEKEHWLVTLVLDIFMSGPARTPSLRDVRDADAILILGEDVTNTAPLLALAVRQAARNRQNVSAAKLRIPAWDDTAVRNAAQDEKFPLFIASPAATKLDDIAAGTFRAAPDVVARLGFAVAHEFTNDAPAVPGLVSEDKSLAREIASVLRNAERPLVISGTGCLSEPLIQAAANVAWALCAGGKTPGLCYAVPECNTLGAGLMQARGLDDAFMSIADEQADTVIILENDLYRRAGSKVVDAFLDRAKNIIVIDQVRTRTTAKADIILPAGTFAESHGTLVNYEGRGQRSYPVFAPERTLQESWRWIDDIIETVQSNESKGSVESKESEGSNIKRTHQTLKTLDSLRRSIAEELSVFNPILDSAPPAEFRINGAKIPRQSHRFSGRTSMQADTDIHEPKPPEDHDSPLAYSMEGYEGDPPPSLISRYWAPGWNSVQALNKFQQETGGPLRGGDPGIRLFDHEHGAAKWEFFTDVPGPVNPGDATPSLPEHRIFGSDELSMLAPSIAELARTKRGTGQ
ncbi:MAG TPA: NADH-quinone oxidoreductase subunit NuoG [Nitrospirota bacterium]|nr:NADH-quinone oxidoreductase subunit NuoG [Nitrospirota bacterium]